MKEYYINTADLRGMCGELRKGDCVYLSGKIYTARDAAHKRFFELMDSGRPLPFNIKDTCIYYTGPTPAPSGAVIGSCGPTTSGRMDYYTPRLLDSGLCAMIGKGPRSEAVVKSIIDNGCVYLCAIGGAGALYASCVTSIEVIAFEDLGCESVKCIEVKDFPVLVGIDSQGGSLL